MNLTINDYVTNFQAVTASPVLTMYRLFSYTTIVTKF